jgi:hypothetical protein
MIRTMLVRPCPICRKPVPWETVPWRPFCSERCKTLDLGAWASEAYRVPVEVSEDEAWTGDAQLPPDRLEP